MFIKVIIIDLFIPSSSSLKEKRFVLASLKTRLRKRFNVAVAEIDFHDKWQRSKLAVVTIGPDKKIVDSGCDKVIRLVESDHRMEVLDCIQELR
jgi:uncharacterized protein YlxP (DUF503 family)